MENQNIQLVAGSKSFKLTITEELEKKIRFMCKTFPSTEWSGVLFYTYEGSFENNNLHLFAKDFHLQDIGNGGYTEFSDDATIINYQVVNDLLDCEMGLIHSHHGMATIFTQGKLGSGTDMNTLKDEGKGRNHFLSLIVNNSGNYAAAITRKVNRKIIGTAAQVYNTFNNVPVIQDGKQFETESTMVEYFMLDIEIEHPVIEKTPLELRIEELKKSTNSYMNKTTFSNLNGYTATPISNANKAERWDGTFQEWMQQKDKEKKEPKQLTIDFGDGYDEEAYMEAINNEHIDKKLIHNHVLQLITGNIFAPFNPNVDLKKWCDNMESVFDKRFPQEDVKDDSFEYYADCMLECLEREVANDERALTLGSDLIDSVWALDLTAALDDLEIKPNRYIDYYIKTLERWIV